MVHKELAQAWWFDGHNLARPSPWLANTLSELDEKTKQMLKLIDEDADSFAQRAEMYYKKRPVLVDMLGDLYRAHRSLAEQCDLLKHGSGTRHAMFGRSSSCTQSWSQVSVNRKPASSCSASSYDSESEVDDPEPEQEDGEGVVEASEAEETKNASQEQQREQEVELMRAEMARLKEQNAELRKVADENAALKAELAGKDDEKREAIRQLASAFDMVKEENSALRERIRMSKNSPPPPARGLDLKKLARDLFSARLLFPPGPIVAL